jgi:hypothetical protein
MGCREIQIDRSGPKHASPFTNAISGLVVAAFCIMAFTQAGDPLHLDNFDFPAVAKAVTETGLPIYYRGEDLPQHSGLYHPPLYIYTLAGWFDIFGRSPTAARSLSIFCAVLSGFLALLICRTLFGRRLTRQVAPFFLILYLLNPFALQAFAIADVDTSILAPLFILTIWTTLRPIFTNGIARTTAASIGDYALIVLALLLCFWAKLTTPLLLPPIIFCILQIRYGLIKAALLTAAISLTSFFLFVASFKVFGSLTGLDTSYTWHFVAESLVSKSVAGASWSSKISGYTTRFFSNFESYGRWDLYLVLGCAVATTARFLKLAFGPNDSRSRWQAASIVSLSAFAVVFFYSLITLPFGGAPFKYVVPAWPLLSLAAACAALHAWRWAPKAKYQLTFVIAAGLLIGVFVLRDRSILAERGLIWTQYGVAVLAAIIIARASLTMFPNRTGHRNLAGMTTLLLIAGLAATGFGRAIAQTRVDYAKQYDYGQKGFRETRDWLISHTSKDEVIMSMKDIASAAQRRYLENYGYLLGNPPLDVMEQRIKHLNVSVFVFTENRGQDQLISNKALSEWIEANTRKVGTFGDYRIYSRNK